jgi:hypothetical protein
MGFDEYAMKALGAKQRAIERGEDKIRLGKVAVGRIPSAPTVARPGRRLG